MRHHLNLTFFAILALPLTGQQEPTPTVATGKADELLAKFRNLLGFAGNLQLTPKVVSGGNGERTIGVEYSYDRLIAPDLGFTEVDLWLESKGTIVADPELTPEARLQHRLRLNVIDLFGSQRRDQDRYRLADGVVDVERAYTAWRTEPTEPHLQELQNRWRDQTGRSDMGPRETFGDDDPGNDKFPLIEDLTAPATGQGSLPFLSLELNLGAETDQDFQDVQWVGGAGARMKWPLLGLPLDLLCSVIRGYGSDQVGSANYDRGPYFWGGVDLVDASNNESRLALTDDDQFARLNIGAFWRNEILRITDGAGGHTPVAIELEWRYYFELDADAAVETAEQDETSWFRGSLLLPHDVLLEYTDGRQPLDLTGGSRLFVGWRFNF